MGKGGRRLLPPTNRRYRGTVKEGQKGTQEEKSRENTAGGRGERKTIPDVEALEKSISDLRCQLDCATQTLVAKDNDLEQLDKEKEKLQQAYNRTKERIRQIGGILWKEGV